LTDFKQMKEDTHLDPQPYGNQTHDTD